MINKNFDYIIVLGLSPKTPDGKFVDFQTGAQGKMYLGGTARMNAAVKAYGENPQATFIFLAGLYIKENGEVLEKGLQMEQFLKDRCPGVRVMQINSLPCTRHNLVALANSDDKEFIGKNVGLLSNAYHENRIKAWQKSLEGEGVKLPEFTFLCTEDFGEPELAGQGDESFDNRIKAEKAGIEKIHSHQYNDHCLSEGEIKLWKNFEAEQLSKMLTNSEMQIFLGRH
jgi:hypothetical protein